MSILVDCTHLRGLVTGIERITLELFSREALSPLPIRSIEAQNSRGMIAKQQLMLPAMMLSDRRRLLICPGFPPSVALYPMRERVIPYVHDTFLASRRRDLNARAKLYLAAPFRLAISSYPVFFVNSETTGAELRAYCRPDATILMYRPTIRNTFGVATVDRDRRPARPERLRIFALGTVEPRKNFPAAGRIVAALRQRGVEADIEIAGRRGWGPDWTELAGMPGVKLLGYTDEHKVRAALERADIFLSTSHDEGLGLPLLEAQHAGLPVFVPDRPVFREVLGRSASFLDPADPAAAADAMLGVLDNPGWRRDAVALAAANLARWNANAAEDKVQILSFLRDRAEARA